MDVERDRRREGIARLVVERLCSGPAVTIAVKADRVCLRLQEAHGGWETRDTTWDPSHMVEAHHIGCLFPGPDAQRAREKVGGFEFQAVTVPLLVSLGEQCCMARV